MKPSPRVCVLVSMLALPACGGSDASNDLPPADDAREEAIAGDGAVDTRAGDAANVDASDAPAEIGGDAASDTRVADANVDAPAKPLVLAAIGDYGVNDAHEADVAAMVKKWSPDFVLTMGDNNYEDGLASTIDANVGKYYAPFIGSYKGTYGAGSATNRFFPSPGNHDWGETRTPKSLAPYLDYFTLPGNERYYDVDLGLVHLYVIDSDPVEPDGNTATSVQAKWLQAKLAASRACYDLVYFHHPPYSSGKNAAWSLRWPFAAWGAEVVLAGHEHFYERLSVDGIPYLIDGLGGAYTHDFNATPDPHSLVRYNAAWGALKITVDASAATFAFFATTSATPIDSIRVSPACP